MTLVLIADDNLDFAELVAECLLDVGATALVVKPAELHLVSAYLDTIHFDAVVVDIDHVDPATLVKQVERCIVTTTRDILSVHTPSLIADWIRKPCAISALSAKVMKVASHRAKTRIT